MTCLYIAVDHETYEGAEKQMRAFAETTHKTEPGFYHKSIRIKCGEDFVFEIHGPLVKAGEDVKEGAGTGTIAGLAELTQEELISLRCAVASTLNSRNKA